MSAPAAILSEWREPSARDGAGFVTRWSMRALSLPLAWKIAGANLLMIAAALATTMGVLGAWFDGRDAGIILALALAGTFAVNLTLIAIALRPLQALESTVAKVRRGDFDARVAATPLADPLVRRVGHAINVLLDELVADRERARGLAAEVIRAGDTERARVARELHDSTAQTLTAVVMQLATTIRDVQPPELAARLDTVRGAVVDALEEVRMLSLTVHPRVLDDLGLSAALRNLGREMEQRGDVPIYVDVPTTTAALSPASASLLYWIAQEAISNALRHASPGAVEVSLRVDGQSATIEILDDGDGFNAGDTTRRCTGLGIFSMRERAALVDGVFELVSAPGLGARVRVTVPIEAHDSRRGAAP